LNRPRLTIIAGANGSGKTTLTGWNSDVFRAIPILDPDTIATTLQSTSPAAFPIAAAREVLASAKEHIGKFEPESPASILDEEDEETLAAIDEGIRDAKAGRTVPAEEVRKRLPKWVTTAAC